MGSKVILVHRISYANIRRQKVIFNLYLIKDVYASDMLDFLKCLEREESVLLKFISRVSKMGYRIVITFPKVEHGTIEELSGNPRKGNGWENLNISIALKIILLSIFAIPGTNVFGSSDVQV
jgi:hypothetical protein